MHAVRPGTPCPCGEPATHQIWEAKLAVCERHAFAWLRSPEKLECTSGREKGTKGGGDWDPGEVDNDTVVLEAVRRFVERIKRESAAERTAGFFTRELIEGLPIVGTVARFLRKVGGKS